MTPWLDDGDVRLYHGDALDVLRELPSGSVHMCATSPPFWNLRDYNAPGQIGLEATPEDWTANLVAVFREVRRVLRDDGTLWIECGDMYASSPPGNVAGVGATSGLHGANDASGKYRETLKAGHATKRDTSKLPNVKAKDLIGAPWLLAFALRADGWYLRSEIIWARPNPMPESVTDRPTKSHSTVFLLSKRPRYFFDADAIREPHAQPDRGKGEREKNNWSAGGTPESRGSKETVRRYNPDGKRPSSVWTIDQDTLDPSLPPEAPRGPDGRRVTTVKGTDASEQHRDGERWPNPSGANARSVWTIPTEPTPFAHFATWPQALVRRMILAGTSERGCCPECGAPWVRDVTAVSSVSDEQRAGLIARAEERGLERHRASGAQFFSTRTTLGWSPSCDCACNDRGGSPYARSVAVPCTVLDPFAGSGTTCLVARNHGRHSIGIELNESYLEIAAKRLQQLSLLSETYSAPAEDGDSHRKETEQSAF